MYQQPRTIAHPVPRPRALLCQLSMAVNSAQEPYPIPWLLCRFLHHSTMATHVPVPTPLYQAYKYRYMALPCLDVLTNMVMVQHKNSTKQHWTASAHDKTCTYPRTTPSSLTALPVPTDSRCNPNPFCLGLLSPEFQFFILLHSYVWYFANCLCTHSRFGFGEWQFYYLANYYLVRVNIP